MKRIYLLFAFCLSLALASCSDKNDDDYFIVDYYPVEFYISLETNKGVDLLNAENEGAVDVDAIELYYDGNTYTLNSKAEPVTRAYHPHFKGMELQKIDGKYRIYVGEFEGSPGFEGGSFAISWGDGTRDNFTYRNTQDGKIGVKHHFYFNGHTVKSGNYPYVSIAVIK